MSSVESGTNVKQVGQVSVPPRRKGLRRPAGAERRRAGADRGDLGGAQFNNFILKAPGEDTPKHTLVQPSFKSGQLVFRPLPTFDDPEAGTFLPYRFDNSPGGYSDFFRLAPGVQFFGEGDNKFSYLLYDPPVTDTNAQLDNPTRLVSAEFYKAAYGKPEKGDPSGHRVEWRDVVGDYKTCPVPRISDFMFMIGIVFQSGDDFYYGVDADGEQIYPLGLDRDDPRVPVVMLKNSARNRLLEEWDAINPDWQGDPNDWEHAMLHGDPVSPDYGRFITIFNPDLGHRGGAPQASGNVMQAGAGRGGRRSGGRKKKDGPTSYEVRITAFLPQGNGELVTECPAALHGEALQYASEKICFFDHLLHIPAPEEQAVFCAKALQHRPEILEWGWRNHTHWLALPEVQDVLRRATKVSMAGTSRVPTVGTGGGNGGMVPGMSGTPQAAEAATPPQPEGEPSAGRPSGLAAMMGGAPQPSATPSDADEPVDVPGDAPPLPAELDYSSIDEYEDPDDDYTGDGVYDESDDAAYDEDDAADTVARASAMRSGLPEGANPQTRG